MSGYYAGLDVGGTTARLLLADEHGAELGSFTGPGCTLNVNGYAVSRQRYRRLVLGALEETGLTPAGCLGICVAASGIDDPGLQRQGVEIFTEMGFAAGVLRVVNDSAVFLLEGTAPRAVLVAGTGSIAMVRAAGGAIYRRGGWGQLLSDEGSAYQLGLSVLRAVGNHLDGRRPCPALWALFQAASPLRDAVAINTFAMQHIGDKPAIAGLAPLLDRAAEQGDAVAAELLAAAAGELFAILRDALALLDAAEVSRAEVLLWGSVLAHSGAIRAGVRQRLADTFGLAAAFPPQDALHTALAAATGQR